MDLIPSFVARKHGRKKVEYPHPAVAEMLCGDLRRSWSTRSR